MGMPWEQQSDNQQWSDREAWRGDVHDDDADAWRATSTTDSSPVEACEWESDSGAADSTQGWPEDLAGPEYWLYKRDGL